jgi:Fe-S oxidoreductase
MTIKTMAQYAAANETPEILFWVGCAGSFDDRAQKVTRAFAEILTKAEIQFAILGDEEACTGDPARRAGNEFLYQMVALQNIEVLNMYGVKKIVTACPHCFNTIKNEYPVLGGNYEVVHHTQLINQLINDGRIKLTDSDTFKGKRITYHDSCYLGRVNGVYEAPRSVLESLDGQLVEMKRSKQNGLCCGAGGAQMWKEDEPGDKRINTERADEALATGAEIVAVNCPFCLTMMTDGVNGRDKQDSVMVMDLSELIVQSM